ncbi:MAG TPA: response regulator [Bryobacteraceae bacterium]|nr:response regulator [Bryobacteraceae bacterium]
MYNILIAEGSGALRNLLSSVLSAVGYDVIVACDGMEALDVADHRSGPIHLLCVNFSVPRFHGVALAERLKAQHPEMKVLLLITDDPRFLSIDDVGAAERHPDYAVMRKPFSVGDLTAKIEEVLATSAAAL